MKRYIRSDHNTIDRNKIKSDISKVCDFLDIEYPVKVQKDNKYGGYRLIWTIYDSFDYIRKSSYGLSDKINDMYYQGQKFPKNLTDTYTYEDYLKERHQHEQDLLDAAYEATGVRCLVTPEIIYYPNYQDAEAYQAKDKQLQQIIKIAKNSIIADNRTLADWYEECSDYISDHGGDSFMTSRSFGNAVIKQIEKESGVTLSEDQKVYVMDQAELISF